MNRSDVNLKSVIIGEGNSFDEAFSLKLDEGMGSYVFVLRITENENDKFLGDFANALNDSFKEKFLEAGDLFDRFEAGVMKLNQVYGEMPDLEDAKISAVLMAESAGKIAITRAGDGEVYLIRPESFMNVGDAIEVSNKSEELFDNVLTGDMKVGDRYIVSNTRLLRYASESNMVRESNRFTFDDFTEWLIKKVEFEIDEKVIVDFFECKDLVFKKVEVEVERDFRYYLKSFKRTLAFIFRSVISGDIKAIDLELRKRIVFITVGLLTLFVVSSLWLAHRSVVQAEVDRFRDELDVAQLIINNAKSEFDKEVIGNMLLNAESKISLARGIPQLDDEAEELREQIKDIKASIDNVVTVEPSLVQNVIGPSEVNFSLQSVHSDDDVLFAVTQNRLFEFVSGIEKEPVTFDPGEGIEKYIWGDENQLYAITVDGVAIEVSSGVSRSLDTDGTVVSSGVGADFYLNQFYVLDPENRQIWKHRLGRENVGDRDPYLLDGYGRFVDSGIDIAIDGYIYVIADGGDVFRFLRGELDPDFRVESKPMLPLLNPTKIYTDLDVPFLFVLEKSENRIVQFFKSSSRNSLQYVRQYYMPEFGEIKDFSVDFLNEKIYLIDDRSIYEFDLDTSST